MYIYIYTSPSKTFIYIYIYKQQPGPLKNFKHNVFLIQHTEKTQKKPSVAKR